MLLKKSLLFITCTFVLTIPAWAQEATGNAVIAGTSAAAEEVKADREKVHADKMELKKDRKTMHANRMEHRKEHKAKHEARIKARHEHRAAHKAARHAAESKPESVDKNQ